MLQQQERKRVVLLYQGQPLLPTIPLGIAARACTKLAAFEINLVTMLCKSTGLDSFMLN